MNAATNDNALREVAARTALLTGATSGLGLAMAYALTEAGVTVGVTGRSRDRAREIAAGLPNAIGIELDVRDEASVRRAV